MAVNILPPGTTLLPGQGLVSPNGRYHLDFQVDGNAVLYDNGQGAPAPGVAYWASNTSGYPLATFTLQPDGQLVIHAMNGMLLWYATPNPVTGSFLVMQDDGDLVLYDTNGNPGWNTQAIGQTTTFLEDLGSGILSIPQTAVDDFVAVIQTFPGVPWLGEQLKDFANTAIGQTFLRALAGGLSAGALTLGAQGGIAAVIGPPLAQVAVAVPGLAKGDKFAAAWISETAWRIATTAQILIGYAVQGYADDINAASQSLSNDLQQATQGVIANLPIIPGLNIYDPASLANLTSQGLNELASRLHVREDSLQSALDAFTGQHSFAQPAQPARLLPGNIPVSPQPARPGKVFDPVTGRQVVALPPASTTSTGAKVAVAVAATAGLAAVGSWIYAHLTQQAYGLVWDKLWKETGKKLLPSSRANPVRRRARRMR